jgi:hypothetical protein
VTRQHEGEGLRRYRALLVAARESLRNAEERFNASSAEIDAHIHAALAALVGRGSLYRPGVGATS